jgi:hypothetical protein
MEIAGIEIPWMEHVSGSKVWPSDDPKDSPNDKFVCKRCGWERHYREYGASPIGHQNDELRDAIRDVMFHVDHCQKR